MPPRLLVSFFNPAPSTIRYGYRHRIGPIGLAIQPTLTVTSPLTLHRSTADLTSSSLADDSMSVKLRSSLPVDHTADTAAPVEYNLPDAVIPGILIPVAVFPTPGEAVSLRGALPRSAGEEENAVDITKVERAPQC